MNSLTEQMVNAKYRVRIIIYDEKHGTPDQPIHRADEPLYGPDELEIVAARVARQLPKILEANEKEYETTNGGGD